MYYVIIRGPAGAGKTAIAKALAKRLDAKYISFDNVLKKHGLDTIKGSCITAKNFIKANKIALISVSKKPVVFDGCFYHKSQLNHLIKELPENPIVFTLKASIDDCIKNDEKRKSIGEKAIIAVHKLVSKFSYGHVIETNNKTEKQLVVEMFKAIKRGS